MPDAFSIIVPYHKGDSYLKLCLESLLYTVRPSDEIIVVINNEEPEIHKFKLNNSRIKYINYYENLGYAKAVNKGVLHAKNDYVIFCDYDLIFLSGWLEKSWKLFASDESIGATSCKLIDPYENKVLDFGIAFSGYNFAHPHLGLSPNHPLVRQNRIVQMGCTGGFLIAKSTFQTVGGFNEEFGTLYTDLDICLRLKSKGYVIGEVADAIAYHFGGDLVHDNRIYKQSYLKADVKGVFMKNNADVIVEDLSIYYKQSLAYLVSTSYNVRDFFF